MAENDQLKNIAGSRPTSSSREDREARIKLQKERQDEYRQKKLDDIKAHALAAQKYKEQKEYERRQRFEELRLREDVKRQQVEERKRAIGEAERDRLEAILKRNQERGAKIEARKRGDRSSMVFAFGSSVPRMLEPVDSFGSFLQRRATSTQNIPSSAVPLTRRQSERELDGGSKKRATSAGGLQRTSEDALRMSSSMYEILGFGNTVQVAPNQNASFTRSSSAHFGASSPQTPAGCASGYVGRRRTDLVPTIPSKEPSALNRRSIACSPASSRPSSALSQRSTSSIASSVVMRPIAAPRRPRPATIAGSEALEKLDRTTKPPLPKPKRTSSAKAQEKLKRKPADSPTGGSTPAAIGATGATAKPVLSPTSNTNNIINNNTEEEKITATPMMTPMTPTTDGEIVQTQKQTEKLAEDNNVEVIKDILATENILLDMDVLNNSTNSNQKLKPEKTDDLLNINMNINMNINGNSQQLIDAESIGEKPVKEVKDHQTEALPNNPAKSIDSEERINDLINFTTPVGETADDLLSPSTMGAETDEAVVDMSASMSKTRITTEEEAKAALAERRRIAREEAERQAEMERLKIEEENRLELERQQREEEQQRLLIEQMKAAEQKRLEEAIKEAQKKEEEDRIKREEENRQKILKEEAEKKAREEAERQKAELAEKLKHEEKEREARRKRVEAIMLRTRGRNSSTPQQTDERYEENSANKLNGSKTENSENGHTNGKDIETVDNNIIPVETLKNANTVVNVDTISTDDTLNSNNSWQRNNTQNDLLM